MRTVCARWVLLHPAFLVALAALVVNDHWLKAAGLLPGWLTGKLSDVAGLAVALALASAALARRRWHVWALAGAIGAVFAAINVHPAAAAALEWATAGLGFGWAIVVDPTDLLALAVLPVTARWVNGRRGPAEASARWTPSRVAAAGAAALACLATSPPPPVVEPLYFQAQVAVLNDVGSEIELRLRHPRPEVALDCVAVGLDPASVLAEAAFGPATTWIMPVRAQVDAGPTALADCYAAQVELDGMEPVLLFWSDDLPPRTFESPLSQTTPQAQTLVLELGAGRRPVASEVGSLGLLYERDAGLPAPLPEGCGVPPRGERLDWSLPVPEGTFTLAAAEYGPDGCWRLDLGEDEGSEPERWYLCVPEDTFPFAAGEPVSVDHTVASGGDAPGAWEAVVLTRIDDPEAPRGALELVASRGQGLPDLPVAAAGFRRDAACPIAVDTCGTASRAGSLRVQIEGEEQELSGGSGDRIDIFGLDGSSLTLDVLLAAEHVVADTSCDAALGVELQVVSVFEEQPEEVTP